MPGGRKSAVAAMSDTRATAQQFIMDFWRDISTCHPLHRQAIIAGYTRLLELREQQIAAEAAAAPA